MSLSRTRRAIPPAAEAIDPEPPGTVIAEGFVPGRPVPWVAPKVGRNGGCVPTRSYKRYQDWQLLVRHTAAVQRPRRKHWPFGGRVELRMRFVLRPRGGRGNPDTSNIVKSTEDAIQGVLIVNDSQVDRIRVERVFSGTEPEGVSYQVIAL